MPKGSSKGHYRVLLTKSMVLWDRLLFCLNTWETPEGHLWEHLRGHQEDYQVPIDRIIDMFLYIVPLTSSIRPTGIHTTNTFSLYIIFIKSKYYLN